MHISLLLCPLNSLWHKSSSSVFVNKNLKASFLFEATLLNNCTTQEERAAAKAAERASPRVLHGQALRVQMSGVPR